MNVLDQFSPATVQMVVTTFMFGATVFPDSDETAELEQLFCFAVSEMVWDELDGVRRAPQGVIDAIVGQLGSDTPDQVRRSFSNLAGHDLLKAYEALRSQVINYRVDPREYCRGLAVSKKIASAAARKGRG
jgi:hypothetical protein